MCDPKLEHYRSFTTLQEQEYQVEASRFLTEGYYDSSVGNVMPLAMSNTLQACFVIIRPKEYPLYVTPEENVCNGTIFLVHQRSGKGHYDAAVAVTDSTTEVTQSSTGVVKCSCGIIPKKVKRLVHANHYMQHGVNVSRQEYHAPTFASVKTVTILTDKTRHVRCHPAAEGGDTIMNCKQNYFLARVLQRIVVKKLSKVFGQTLNH